MSNTIDNRVVEMQFDNAAFEKGVKQTTDSLQNLDKTIANTAKNTEKSSFGSVLSKLAGDMAKIIPTRQVTSAVSAVGSAVSSIFSKTFDMIGTASKIGIGAITGIGSAVTALAATGGLNRALNLEQAQFQLKGLGVAWDAIYSDLDYAVAGTAYGLDSAAKAAAQLVASNIAVGDSMKTALRGISGVAAMTNREYDEVAHIFTTVAGNGRLMGQQLTQLSSYGLNVAAVLGQQMGYTEAEIRDMVSEGKISFEQFAQAMDSAFGEHAKAANETFTGAMSNVKAALSRIGAEFWLPLHESLRKIFVDLIPVINLIKKSLTPVIDAASSVMDKFQSSISGVLKGIGYLNDGYDENGIKTDHLAGIVQTRLTNTFKNLVDTVSILSGALSPLGSIFNNIFDGRNLDADTVTYKIESLSKAIHDFVYNNIETVYSFTTGLADNLNTIVDGFKEAGKTISDFFGGTAYTQEFTRKIGSTFDEFGNAIPIFEKFTAKWTVLDDLMINFSAIIDNLSPILSTFIGWWNKLANAGLKIALPLFTSFVELLAKFSQKLNEAFFSSGGPAESFGNFIDKVVSGAEDLFPSMEELGSGVDFLAEAFGRLLDKIKLLKPDLSGLKDFFSGIKDSLFPANVSTHDFSFLDSILDFFKNINIRDVMSAINSGTFAAGLFGIVRVIRSVGQAIGNVFKGGGKLGLENFLGLDFTIFNRTMNQLSYTFNSLTSSIKSNIILKIAASILVFAAALKVLSSLNPEQLISVTVALGEFVATVALMFKILEKSAATAKPTAIISMIVILSALSSAMIKMSIAMKILGSIDTHGIIVAVVGLAAIVVAITGLMFAMVVLSEVGSSGAILAASFVVSQLSSTMIKMSIAMKILGSIDTHGIIVAVVGLAAIVVAITGLMFAMVVLSEVGSSVDILAASFAISQLSGMFLSLSLSMKILSSIKPESLLSSIVGLAAVTGAAVGLLAAIGIFAKSTVNVMAAASTFTVLSVLFLAMTLSMKILSTIDNSSMQTAVLGLISTVTALSLLISVIGLIPAATVLTGAFAIGNMGMLLTNLSAALKTLSKIEAKGLLQSILAVYAVVGGLAGIVYALSEIDPKKANTGVNGLLMMSLSLMLIAPAMKLISSIPIEGVVSLLVSLGGAMLILGAAVEFIPGPQLFVFAAGLAAIAASALMFGAAAALFGIGLMNISVGLSTLVSVLGVIASDISNSMRIMAEAFVTFVVESAKGLASNTKPLVDSGIKIMTSFLSGLATLIPEVVTLGVRTVLSFLEGIANNIASVVSMAVTIISNFLMGIASQIGTVIDSAMWVGIMFIKGLADGIRENAEFVGLAVESLVQTIGSVLLGGLAGILESNPLTAPLAGDIRGASDELASAAAEASAAIQAKFDEKFGEIESNADGMSSGIVGALSAPGQYEPIGAGMASGVSSGFTSGSEQIPTQFDGVISQVMSSMDSASADAQGKGAELGENYNMGLDSTSDTIVNTFTNAANRASDSAGSVDSNSDGYTVGSNLGSGIYSGMEAWRESIADKARQMVSEAKNAANSEMDAASPAKDLIKSGGWFGEGFMIGIANMIQPVAKTASKMTDAAKEQVTGLASVMGSIFDTIDWDANPVITPVLDTSLIRSGLGSMYGMMSNPSFAYSASGFSMTSSGMPRVPISGRNNDISAPISNVTQIYIDGDLLRSDDDLRGLYEQWTMELNRRIMK